MHDCQALQSLVTFLDFQATLCQKARAGLDISYQRLAHQFHVCNIYNKMVKLMILFLVKEKL